MNGATKALSLLFLICGIAHSSFGGQGADRFGHARWIWPAQLGCVTNTVVEYRAVFSAERETQVRLAIAADTVYAVSLNGGERKIGRFPDIPPMRFYDILDLGQTVCGSNEVSVLLYVQGRDSFQHIPGKPGVIFCLKGEGVWVDSGLGVDWRLSARERRDGVPLVTSQLGYSFEYDAAVPMNEWRRITEADVASPLSEADLRLRPAPRAELSPGVVEKVVGQGRLDGSPVPAVPSAGMDAASIEPVDSRDFFEDGSRAVRPEHFKGGFHVLVDLGREECGLLFLDIDTDSGVVVDVGHAEHEQNGRIQAQIGARNFCGRYRAREGRQSYCCWARRMAGRYLQLHVRGVRTRFRLHRATICPMELPVAEKPAPAFGDARMAEIFRVGVRTLRLCMHEHYEDCPWREQALYANDSRLQMLSGYFAFDDGFRMPELAMELLARGIGEDGWVPLCMPTRLGRKIPSFTFSWVLALGDHLKFRRDIGFVRRMMPSLRKVLDSRMAELRNGLLPCPPGARYWHFYDWAKDLDNEERATWKGDRFDAPLNLFCILALESGSTCAQAIGDSSSARSWHEAAERMRTAVREGFWDRVRGEFRTQIGARLAPSELVQALALLAGCVPAESRSALVARLSAPSDWTETTLSQSFYKYEALMGEGESGAEAVRNSIGKTWGRMIDDGATSFWEVKEGWRAFNRAASLCHGWSAIPVYFLGAYPALRSNGARK